MDSYRLVTALKEEELERRVNLLIRTGYKPLYAPSAVAIDNKIYYIQALVHYEKKEKPEDKPRREYHIA